MFLLVRFTGLGFSETRLDCIWVCWRLINGFLTDFLLLEHLSTHHMFHDTIQHWCVCCLFECDLCCHKTKTYFNQKAIKQIHACGVWNEDFHSREGSMVAMIKWIGLRLGFFSRFSRFSTVHAPWIWHFFHDQKKNQKHTINYSFKRKIQSKQMTNDWSSNIE